MPTSPHSERSQLEELWLSKLYPEEATESYFLGLWNDFIADSEEERVKRRREAHPADDPRAQIVQPIIVDSGGGRTMYEFYKNIGLHIHSFLPGDTRVNAFGQPALHREAVMFTPVGMLTAMDRRKDRGPDMTTLDGLLWLSDDRRILRLHTNAVQSLRSPPALLKEAFDLERSDDFFYYCQLALRTEGYSGPEAKEVYKAVVRALIIADTDRTTSKRFVTSQQKLIFAEENVAELLALRSQGTNHSKDTERRLDRLEEQNRAPMSLTQASLQHFTQQPVVQQMQQPLTQQPLVQQMQQPLAHQPFAQQIQQALQPFLQQLQMSSGLQQATTFQSHTHHRQGHRHGTARPTLQTQQGNVGQGRTLNPGCWNCNDPAHKAPACTMKNDGLLPQ